VKFAVIVPDGAADLALDELGGRTPLEAAYTPAMDGLAARGETGMVRTIPAGLEPGSDVANLSVLGYDPSRVYSGRAPLEAAARGIDLGPGEWAWRVNFVTEADGVLADYSAGHVSAKEAEALLGELAAKLAPAGYDFVPGVGYRNLLIVRSGEDFSKVKTTPPHDIQGRRYKRYLPKGAGARPLKELVTRSLELLDSHELNRVRADLGENPANMIWIWGGGERPELPSFRETYGLEAAVISAVDLVKGIARVAGMAVIEVPGATGYIDTDYAAKGEAAVKALGEYDLVFVHVEAPDEAAHNGWVDKKVEAIERIDKDVVTPIAAALEAAGEHRILVLPDHQTPISTRTHTAEPVPYALAGTGVEPSRAAGFSELAAAVSGVTIANGHELMRRLVGGDA